MVQPTYLFFLLYKSLSSFLPSFFQLLIHSQKSPTHARRHDFTTMATSTASAFLSSNSLLLRYPQQPQIKPHSSSSFLRISAVANPDQNKKSVATPPAAASPVATPVTTPGSGKWSVSTWKTKKALQLPTYPDVKDLESVLGTIETFPPIVFAGEARHLEEKLAEAAMGRAFLLQGGDCAESFKEFNANNIRDTFRVLLQMGAVLTFGGQMPVIKVNN